MRKPEKDNNDKSASFGKVMHVVLLFLYVIILSASFFKTYHKVFDEKIFLGGDNAGYYILGTALATGQGYTNIHSIEKTPHNHFPPGYPVIIAAAMKIFSTNIIFIKKLNGFFLFLSLALLYLIIRQLTGNNHVPFITVLFLIYNFHLLNYSFIMMSEIPFLFFSLLAIWLFMKTDFSKPLLKNGIFLLLILTLSFNYYIRATGLSLFVGIALYLGVRKNWKYLATITAGFILLALPWVIRTQKLGGSPYVHSMFMVNPYRPELGPMHFGDWFSRFFQNLERYITREIPSGIFDFIQVTNYKNPIAMKEWIIGIIVVLIMIYGLIRLRKYADFFFYYLLATFGILLLWPVVWIGVRFLLPFIPLLTFLFINGIIELLTLIEQKTIKLRNPLIIPLTLVAISLFAIKSYGKESLRILEFRAKAPYPKKYNNYFEIARWAYKNTPDTSVIACRKGQLFYLFSRRYVTGYASTLDKEKQIEYLKSKSTDYVVLEQLGFASTKRYLFPAIKRYPEKFKILKHLKNPDTYFMRFLPELGYWGTWKDDKKNGRGTYVWPNGQKYVGGWKDNLKNGKGVLYATNGLILEGTWVNDKLNGLVTIKNKFGKILNVSEYKDNVRTKLIFQNQLVPAK